MEKWADGVIAEDPRAKTRMTFDPLDVRRLTAVAVKGAAYMEQGIRNFADWSKAMVAEFGEGVRPHLQDLFSRSANYYERKYTQGKAVGPIHGGSESRPSFENVQMEVRVFAGKLKTPVGINTVRSLKDIPDSVAMNTMVDYQMSHLPYKANESSLARSDIAKMSPEDLTALKVLALQARNIDGGFVDPATKSVFVVSDKIRSQEHLKQVLRHEVLGHVAADRMLGELFLGSENETFKRGVAKRHENTELGKSVRELYGNDNQLTIGSEIIAKLSETPSADPALWKQVTAEARRWVRKVFDVDVSDNDIQVLLSKSRSRLGIKGGDPSVAQTKTQEGGKEVLTTQAAAGTGPPLQPSAAGATQPQTPVEKTPKSQRQIIEDLAKGLNLPIRFGRLLRQPFVKGPAGYFQNVENLIGSKKANDVPVVSHEAGHKLDTEFSLSSDPALAAELNVLGDPATPGSRSSWTPNKSQQYRLEEGVAEFTRQWLNDGPAAQAAAPNTFARFESALNANKDFADTMRTAQGDIKTWRDSPSQARLRSHISVGENPNKTPYTLSQLTRDLVDDLHFMRLAVDDANKLSGTTTDPSSNPYLLARNLRGSFGMAASFIRNGVADFNTKAVTLGTSLESALKPVAGRINDFRDWIVAKRAQELHAQGRDTGLLDVDIQNTAARFNNDAAFQEAFTKIKAWNDALLKYAEDSGLVTADGATAMRAMNQDFVPMHKVFEVGAGEAPSMESGGSGRGLNVGKPGSLKGLKGSPRPIVDPLETMVKNAYAIITASEKQAISRATADLASKPGMGQWVEKIATPQDAVKVGLAKVRKQLTDAGADLDGVPNDLLLAFFQNSKHTPFGENIIKVMRDGKPEYYRLKRELSDTFHALDFDDAGTLLRMFSAPANLLRAGVTLAPDFAFANSIRDTFGAAVISKHGLLPFEATIRGIAAMLKNPKLIAEWEAAGGKSAIEATYFDRTQLQKFLNEKITKDLTPAEQALVIAKSPLQALRWLTGVSEEATRIGEYQKAFNDLTKGGMPEGEARRLAAFEARDRQDFSKGGSRTKPVRHMAAFWNAALQANVRLAQAFKERPGQTILKGLAYVTLAKLAEQAINWNDEDYWDRPQWERDLFFLVPIGKGDGGHTRFLRIPTPFEIGVIFGTLPGRILQSIKEGNAEAAKDFPLLLAKQTVPNPLPQTIQVLFADFLSGKKGWDIWRGRQVVPESLSDLPAGMQWTEQTSLTARKAGDLIGFPPVKIDHIIAGTSGGLGKQVTHQIVDRAISLATGEEAASSPVIPGSRFVTAPASVASASIEDFYTTLNELKTSVAGAKAEKSKSKDRQWAGIFEERAKQMSEQRKLMRQSNNEAVKQQKAEQILKLARQTMKQYREQKAK